MKNKEKGFTLIELLVVIAIIGILSSVVLASLTTARSKGTDAAIQADLSNMRAQAELLYSNNSNVYTNVPTSAIQCSTSVTNDMFGTSTVGSLKNITTDLIAKAKGGASGTMCAAGTSFWAVAASTTSGTWCADSTGKSASTTMQVVSGVASCL